MIYSIEHTLGLVSYFIAQIVLILVIGTLVSCFIENKCMRKHKIKSLFMFLFLIAIFVIISLSILLDYGIVELPPYITLLFVFASILIFIIASVINWKFLNKPLFFSIIAILLIVVLNEVIKLITTYKNFTIVGSVGLILHFLFLYFLVVDWKITINEKK